MANLYVKQVTNDVSTLGARGVGPREHQDQDQDHDQEIRRFGRLPTGAGREGRGCAGWLAGGGACFAGAGAEASFLVVEGYSRVRVSLARRPYVRTQSTFCSRCSSLLSWLEGSCGVDWLSDRALTQTVWRPTRQTCMHITAYMSALCFTVDRDSYECR